MARKKKTDATPNDELELQQQEQQDEGAGDGDLPESGESLPDANSVPELSEGGENLEGAEGHDMSTEENTAEDPPDEAPTDAGPNDGEGEAPPPIDGTAGDDTLADEGIPLIDAQDSMDNPETPDSALYVDGDPEDGGELGEAYGNLGDMAEDNDDLYGEGEEPPQFDLSGIANPPEGALMLDSGGPFTETELAAAAAALPEGAIDNVGDSDSAPAPTSPRRKRRTAGSEEPAAQPETPAAVPARRRRASSSTSNVLSIDENLKVQSSEDKDALLWMELRGSLRSKRILTGTMGGVERNPAGGCIAVVYYKDQRIVIPADEMFIDLSVHQTESARELQNRYAQILTRNLNAEVDFIISGIDRRGNSVVASRKEAMIRKQINYYHPTARRRNPMISEDMVVEARIISVGTKNIRVEVFGVETTIWARYVAWEWVEDCSEYFQVGDRVLVKVMAINRSNPAHLSIEASIRDCFPNPALQNIEKCNTQGKYIGKVTGMDTRAIYVRLNVGVNGIATACHDRKVPGRKDDVSFVITKLDKEQGVAIGIITKIIKQHF